MRILFVGTPDMALICLLKLLEDKHNIVGIVPPASSHPAFLQMCNLAAQHDIPCVYFNEKPSEPSFLKGIKALNPDIAVVCSFDKLFPEEFLNIMPMGVINCHPSILPDYRGGNPYFHVINNNEKYTGITLHMMDSQYDTGDIVYQEKIDLAQDETMGTLFNRLNFRIADILTETLTFLKQNSQLPFTKQDKEGNYKKAKCIYPEKGDTIIDWQNSAEQIECFIRACNPFYGAVTSFRNCQIKIWSAFYENKDSSKPVGQIVKVTKDGFSISTGKGLLYPTTLQIGTFVLSDVKDFVRRLSPSEEEYFL